MFTLRFHLKTLLVLVAVSASIFACYGRLRNLAVQEHAAYNKLCELGALGDDWMSPTELITGRPPIVKIWIPASIDAQVAMPLLPKLTNLESLILDYDSMTARDLRVIEQLPLRSLTFRGKFPTDDDIEELTRFDTVSYLALPSQQLGDQAISRLKERLPRTILKLR